MARWVHFPRSTPPLYVAAAAAEVFKAAADRISSAAHELSSNQVLAVVEKDLRLAGFEVESGKKADEKINVPVFWGYQGATGQTFDVDAWHEEDRAVLEVEAGRAVVNNQFLKDLFEACMMPTVDYLILAVRETYKTGRDFERVVQFFETLYASRRLELPLKGVTVIGY